MAGLFLIFLAAKPLRTVSSLAPGIAVLILACNPAYQRYANWPMSEAVATALNLCAFAIWIASDGSRRSWLYCALGATVALSCLTRPEGIILLPIWCVADWICSKQRPALRSYCLAFAVCALVLAPYVTYLYGHTGTISLSQKSEVNLAGGRANYFNTPREFIGASSLPGHVPSPWGDRGGKTQRHLATVSVRNAG